MELEDSSAIDGPLVLSGFPVDHNHRLAKFKTFCQA